MSANKTGPTKISVDDFLSTLTDEGKRKDSYELIRIMQKLSGEEATMWGPTIIGFGTYHYKYASGKEGDMCRIGFSPRKAEFSLYLTCSADDFSAMLEKFGKHKTGKGCIYFKKLADVNRDVLEEMIKKSLKETKELYG